MTTAVRQNRWYWNNVQPCANCGVEISGRGETGMCRRCAHIRALSVTQCKLCSQLIPRDEPRIQYVHVSSGGRQDRQKGRRVLATICYGCWSPKRKVTNA